jgi:hypothetical protein
MQDMAIVVVLDVVLALAAGFVLADRLSTYASPRRRPWIWLLILLGIHAAEVFAFSASMATNVLSYCLAAVWSLLFASKLHTREMRLLSLYASLPAISFLAILEPLQRAGWGLTDIQEGYRFGIPHFVPPPFCTVLGFVIAVSVSAVLGKLAITLTMPAILRHLHANPQAI